MSAALAQYMVRKNTESRLVSTFSLLMELPARAEVGPEI